MRISVSFTRRLGGVLLFAGAQALAGCNSSSSDDKGTKPDRPSADDATKDDEQTETDDAAGDDDSDDEASSDADGGELFDFATTPVQQEIEALLNREDTTCYGAEDPAAFTVEVLSAAREAYAAGETSIPLSTTGCTRMFVEREDGEIISESLIAPPVGVTFGSESFEIIYLARVSTWTFDADEGEQLEQDREGDGFFEIRAETVYGKQTVVEQFAPDGSVLGRQTTSLVGNDNGLETLSELYLDGELADSLTNVSSRLQAECRDPVDSPPPLTPEEMAEALKDLKPPKTRTCSDDEQKAIDKATDEALGSVMTCLTALHPGTADLIIQQHLHHGYRVHCGQLHLDREAVTFSNGGVLSGPVDIYLDPSALVPAARGALASTIFHELMHTNDTHDSIANNAAGYDNLTLIDPIYACEKVCMGTGVTECHLAACLGEKLSETWVDRSGKLRACWGKTRVPGDLGLGFAGTMGVSSAFTGKSGYIGPCSSGRQVGALCRKIKGSEEPMAQFCSTESECNENCEGDCESFSLSCDKSCR